LTSPENISENFCESHHCENCETRTHLGELQGSLTNAIKLFCLCFCIQTLEHTWQSY